MHTARRSLAYSAAEPGIASAAGNPDARRCGMFLGVKWLTAVLGFLSGDPDYGNPVPLHLRRFAGGPPTRCACTCHASTPPACHAQACCAPCKHCGTGYSAGLVEHEANCAARESAPA